jgi:hypothetical protein
MPELEQVEEAEKEFADLLEPEWKLAVGTLLDEDALWLNPI